MNLKVCKLIYSTQHISSFNEFIHLVKIYNSLNENKKLKHLPTKKIIVKGKKKPFIRNQHVNIEKKVDSQGAISVKESEVNNIKPVFQGISGGTVSFTANGKKYYHKPVSGEKFVSGNGKFIKDSIRLNNKETGKPLEDPHGYKMVMKNAPDLYKGKMADREEMSFKLSERLGLDHVVKTEKTNLTGQVGSTTLDAHEQFKDRYTEIDDIASYANKHDGKSMLSVIAKEDPRRAEKAIYDFLIGNMDRHSNNMLGGKNKKTGKMEMIAFDNDQTQPNSNKTYLNKERDYKVQQIFNDLMSTGSKPSIDFVGKLDNFRKNKQQFTEFVTEIKDKIGEKEAISFVDRYSAMLQKFKPEISAYNAKKRK